MRLKSIASGLMRWLVVDPHVFWIGLLAPFVALILARPLPMQPEAKVRTAGFTITFLGVVLVGRGILDTQALFERPSYRSRVKLWMRRLKGVFQPRRAIIGHASLEVPLAMTGRGHVWSKPQDPASLESRVIAVEENVTRVNERLVQTENRLDETGRRIDELVAKERHARQQAIESVATRLEKFSAGSLDWEIAGAWWVIAGQAFGSFPSELASLARL